MKFSHEMMPIFHTEFSNISTQGPGSYLFTVPTRRASISAILASKFQLHVAFQSYLSSLVFHIDLYNTGSRIQWHQVKPAEMTNLEYQDGGQSASGQHFQ